MRSETQRNRKEIQKYCRMIVGIEFNGETSNHYGSEVTDQSNLKLRYHLGVYLKLADECIRQHNERQYYGFSGEEEDFLLLLKMIAIDRKNKYETNTQSYERLMHDSKRFVRFLHQRKTVDSKPLTNTSYWGTRQQFRAGKVIADWIDRESIDPVFGILLCPTAGRTGPGDSFWLHRVFFDQSGPFAYHSAVHDAFGYLKLNHNVGPGYNYLKGCSIFDTTSPLSGHLPGAGFWKEVLSGCKKRNDCRKNVKYTEIQK